MYLTDMYLLLYPQPFTDLCELFPKGRQKYYQRKVVPTYSVWMCSQGL